MAAGKGGGGGCSLLPRATGLTSRSLAPVSLPCRDGGEGCPAVGRPEAAGGHGTGSGAEPTCAHPGRSHQRPGCRERVPGESLGNGRCWGSSSSRRPEPSLPQQTAAGALPGQQLPGLGCPGAEGRERGQRRPRAWPPWPSLWLETLKLYGIRLGVRRCGTWTGAPLCSSWLARVSYPLSLISLVKKEGPHSVFEEDQLPQSLYGSFTTQVFNVRLPGTRCCSRHQGLHWPLPPRCFQSRGGDR